MKKCLSLTLILVSLVSLSACQSVNRAIKGDKYVNEKMSKDKADADAKAYEKKVKKALTAPQSAFPQLTKEVSKDEAKVILKTSQGDITLKLFPKIAPLAVENFLTHAKKGYYNNVSFHRVISEFMIQTGDPKGDGTGGQSIWYGKDKKKDAGNGFKNETSLYLYNLRGALAMANAGPDTNGSQFFINQNTQDQSMTLSEDNYPKAIIEAYKNGGNPSLDGGYTVFGKVVDGMDVVDNIASTSVDEKDKPRQDITITSIDIQQDYNFK